MAETYNLGKVCVSPKGAWNAQGSYTILDAVTHRGGSYLATAASGGVEPGVTSNWANYWMVLTKGITGVSARSNSGVTTMSVNFTDGSSYTFSFNTTTLAPGSTYTQMSAVLSASGWNSSTMKQSVTVSGLTSSRAVFAGPDTTSASNKTAYDNAGVYPSGQATNRLTFTCRTVPTSNLTVNIFMPV